jgi:hypothetical protein
MATPTGSTGIHLDLNFPIWAEALKRPDVEANTFLDAYDTVVEIDGVRHEFGGGKAHFLECSAGPHLVRVYFLQNKIFGLFRPLGHTQFGPQEATIDVTAGETFKLVYDANVGWRIGNASLHTVA